MQSQIRAHAGPQAAQELRAGERRRFARNQVFGLLLLAAVVCAWWLLHTNPKWIFPPGWWRP